MGECTENKVYFKVKRVTLLDFTKLIAILFHVLFSKYKAGIKESPSWNIRAWAKKYFGSNFT